MVTLLEHRLPGTANVWDWGHEEGNRRAVGRDRAAEFQLSCLIRGCQTLGNVARGDAIGARASLGHSTHREYLVEAAGAVSLEIERHIRKTGFFHPGYDLLP